MTTSTLSVEGLEAHSVSMSLRSEAASEAATRAITDLALQIHDRGEGRRPLPKRVRLLAALIADLLKGAAFNPVRPCFRPMSTGDFTSEPFGYHSFKATLDCLVTASFVLVDRGWLDPATRRGRVTRIYPTGALLSALAAFDITPSNRDDHFKHRSDIPLIIDPIRLRARSRRRRNHTKYRGRPLPVPMRDPIVSDLVGEVNAINDFLAKQAYEGMAFDGLFRGFNNGDDADFAWDKGGRLYAVGGGYQSMKKQKRKLIRINGEATAEVDISASHLTILHGLMKVALPKGKDPYTIPGLDRDPVKRFVTTTMGSGKIPVRWPADAVTDYAEEFKESPRQDYTGNLRKDYPFRTVRDRVLTHIPLLKEIASYPYGWAELQYAEANILIAAMKVLMEEGIPSLPIHDSLIVPHSYKSEATKAISDSFYQSLGIEPLIK